MKLIQRGFFVQCGLYPGTEVSFVESGGGQRIREQFFVCVDAPDCDLDQLRQHQVICSTIYRISNLVFQFSEESIKGRYFLAV